MPNYRKIYLCTCDGQQEEMYLKHVAELIKDFPRKVVKFNTIIDSPGRLEKEYVDYDGVALFDFDFKDVEFERNIRLCESLNKKYKSTKRKKGRNIYHAYSNVNFDLWLILHKEEFNHCVGRNDAYIRDVRRIYRLGSDANIKNADIINKILRQIDLEDVKDAIRRAECIRNNKMRDDGKIIGSTVSYPNPDFSIHAFLRGVLKDSDDL